MRLPIPSTPASIERDVVIFLVGIAVGAALAIGWTFP